MSDLGRKFLTERFEGLQLSVYPDPATGAAPLTAGYGHTGPDVMRGMIVTQDIADAWLAQDLAAAEAAVNSLVQVQITQDQFDALTDFTYNVGSGNFASSTILGDVNASNFDAADAQFARWVYAHGRILAGLAQRRAQEAAWFSGQTTT